MMQGRAGELPAPTAEEIQEWLNHPVTKYFKDFLGDKAREMQAAWADGVYTDSTQSTVASYVCRLLQDMSEMTLDFFN